MAENNEMLTGYMLGQDGGGNGMWGNDGIWAFLLFALIFGGRGGFGGFGGNGGGDCATKADVRAAVDQQTLISKLDQQTYGLADSTYALNNTINNGFHGVDNGLCDLRAQLAQCCCDNRAAIADLKYTISSDFCALGNTIQNNTRDIIDSQNAGTRAILDFLVQDKITTLQSENQALRFQASQTAQNQFITQVGADIVNRLQPPPIPAYQVPNPYAGYGYTGCGCGCGCG